MISHAKWYDRWFVHPGYLIWGAIVYGCFLSRLGLAITGDEKQYLATALEMVEHGSWLKPYLFGEPSYYKPPLQFWAMVASLKLFGRHLWAALLPSLLAALGTAFFLGQISLLLNQRRELVRSGLWFLASIGTATFAVVAQMEIFLCFFITAAWWAVLRWAAEPFEARNDRSLFIAFALAGLLCIVKSPLYFVLWTAGLVIFLLISGEWESFRTRNLYLAASLGALLGGAWYVAILIVDRERFLSDYVFRETIAKQGGNQTSPFGIWKALLYWIAPMTCIAIPSLRAVMKRRKANLLLRLMTAWGLPIAVFFTLFPYRVNTYLYVLVPLAALVVDWGTVHERRTRAMRVFVSLTGAAMSVALIGVIAVLTRASWVPIWVLAIFGASALAFFVAALRSGVRSLLVSTLIGIGAAQALVAVLAANDVRDLHAYLVARPGRAVGMLDLERDIWHDVGLVSLSMSYPIARVTNLEEAYTRLSNGEALAVSPKDQPIALPALQARVAASEKKRVLTMHPWRRWGRRKDIKLQTLIFQGNPEELERGLKREYQIIELADSTT